MEVYEGGAAMSTNWVSQGGSLLIMIQGSSILSLSKYF